MKNILVRVLLTAIIILVAYAVFIAIDPVRDKNYVVCLVNPDGERAELTRGFIDGLAEFGYVEGRNLTLLRYLSPTAMDAAAKELADRRLDMIFTVSTPATIKLKSMASDKGIPLVFVLYDPVAAKILDSLTGSGGNVTGLRIRGCAPKALGWLLVVFPDVRHVFVPIAYDSDAARLSLAEFSAAAESSGVRLSVAEVHDSKELQTAIDSMAADVDALFLLDSLFISFHAKEIIEAGFERGLPTGAAINKARQGALVAYGPDLYQLGKQASRLGHITLLQGSAQDVPIEKGECRLAINIASADRLDLKIPNDKLIQADEIYR